MCLTATGCFEHSRNRVGGYSTHMGPWSQFGNKIKVSSAKRFVRTIIPYVVLLCPEDDYNST